jgi:hypothetical protein
MSSTYETVATALIGIINTEFAAEGFTAIRDNLHDSLGRTRVDIGVAPSEDVVMSGNSIVQETWLDVKFLNFWDETIAPDTVIDPAVITGYAERFRTALRIYNTTAPHTGRTWYFDVRRIAYPNDPTGNKSRFVATIRAYGNNAGLIESSG